MVLLCCKHMEDMNLFWLFIICWCFFSIYFGFGADERLVWLCYSGFKWTEKVSTPRFPRSYRQLKYFFFLHFLQLLSCFPPTVSVLLRSFQGSDFLSCPHIESLQTWKVPHTHSRHNCSFKSTPPLLNAQKNKLSKKPAGQSVSHHIRTAMPS